MAQSIRAEGIQAQQQLRGGKVMRTFVIAAATAAGLLAAAPASAQTSVTTTMTETAETTGSITIAPEKRTVASVRAQPPL